MTSNNKFGEVYKLSGQIEADNDKVSFRNIFENSHGGVSLLAFKAGQKLDKHLATAEVMVCVIEGSINFTMIDQFHNINAGEFMLMGANVPHSVEAVTDAKVMLVKIKE